MCLAGRLSSKDPELDAAAPIQARLSIPHKLNQWNKPVPSLAKILPVLEQNKLGNKADVSGDGMQPLGRGTATGLEPDFRSCWSSLWSSLLPLLCRTLGNWTLRSCSLSLGAHLTQAVMPHHPIYRGVESTPLARSCHPSTQPHCGAYVA